MAAAASPLTTHVLDTSRGTPARNVQIQLFRLALDSSSGDLAIIGSWDLLKEGLESIYCKTVLKLNFIDCQPHNI